MAQKRPFPWPAIILVLCVIATVIALPDSMKGWAPPFLKPQLHLGLDLAGGTQLDFRISEDEIEKRIADLETAVASLKAGGDSGELIAKQNELLSLQQQRGNLVEAIRTVLERRINALGVSEATVTPSYYGTEKHLFVDCPGIIDPQLCIESVGKTIQLEFKEQLTEATPEFEADVRAKAQQTFAQIQSGSGNLKSAGEDLSNDLGIAYDDSKPYFQSELPDGLKDAWNRQVNAAPVLTEGTFSAPVMAAGGGYQLTAIDGIYISEVTKGKETATRPLTNPPTAIQELTQRTPGATFEEKLDVDPAPLPEWLRETVLSQAIGSLRITAHDGVQSLVYLSGRTEGEQSTDVSHILVAYKGASRAEAGVTRTKAEAKKHADELKKQLAEGTSFDVLARTQSDATSKAQAGAIGRMTRGGDWPAAFETAAFALKQGQISDVIETPFGFHIIRANSDATSAGAKVSYHMLTLGGADAETQVNAFAEDLRNNRVTRTEEQIMVRSLFFSLEPTGWKDTDLNGDKFLFASVTTDGMTNIPVVQIQFTEEGGRIFQELTKRNVGKPIAIFVGGELVSQPTVQQEIIGSNAVITGVGTFQEAQKLAQDLNTGAIPAPIHLSGQSTIGASLGDEALRDSVRAGIIGFILLCILMIFLYRALGVVAVIALAIYAVLLVAMMKLPLLLVTNTHIVLTVAGIAGVILSIGMAVDANVLVFERIKEELRRGKSLKTAAAVGFKKAWPSIRDGNVSTLITSAILIFIGTSIVRGFAITLSLGVVLSLFTAIIVTRWLLERLMESPIAERKHIFGVDTSEESTDK